MDWKELEIGNIPSDFFVNDRYEIELFSMNDGWRPCNLDSTKRRVYIIENIIYGKYLKYRYRLKPTEPMRITKEALDVLQLYIDNYLMNGESIENVYGRPVELID